MTTAILDRATIDAIAASGLRMPDLDGYPIAPTRTCTWTPDLTTAEQATLADITAMTASHITGLSLTEYQALKPDLAGLRTYAGIATPTLVQTAAAVKAQSRVILALLRG